MPISAPFNRRQFIKTTALGAGALAASGIPLASCADQESPSLEIALVGLGYYATHQLAPAILASNRCHLAGIVSGTPEKREKWAKDYNIPPKNIYSYETFDDIADNDDIDAVYIVLPNGLHAEYSIRAAKAGKHVLCEKPMAISVAECDEMIAACQQHNRHLSIGYRCHHEPHNKEMMRLGKEEVYGKVKLVEAAYGWRGVSFNNWRFDHSLSGGGALMDVGIYCLQAAIYTLGEKPVSITAQETKTYMEKFAQVDETLLWQMRFESGAMATCSTSYAIGLQRFRAAAEEGNFELNPAFAYNGIRGWVNGKPMDIKEINQQAAHMDAFAATVYDAAPNITPGEMGRRDMQIIETIYRAADSGMSETVSY